MAFKWRLTFPRLLLVCYLLSCLILSVLLLRKEEDAAPLLNLAKSSIEKDPSGFLLSFHGDGFSSDLQGVLAQSLTTEAPLVWRVLQNVPTRGVAIGNGFALVSCYGNKLVSLSLEKGQATRPLGSITLPEDIIQITISGELAMVGLQNYAGLVLIDLHDLRDLKLLLHYPWAGLVTDQLAGEKFIYYADIRRGVGRIDPSAKSPMPTVLQPLKSAWRITLQGEKMVVATIDGVVHLFEIAEDYQLKEVGILTFPVNVRGVCLVEDSLVIALANGILQRFNLSSWPELADPVTLKLPGNPLQLRRVAGQPQILVNLIAGGLALVDVSEPGSPVLSGLLNLPKTFKVLEVNSGLVYGTGLNGLEAYSLDLIADKEALLADTNAMLDHNYYEFKNWRGHIYGFRKQKLVDFGAAITKKSLLPEGGLAVADNGSVLLFQADKKGVIEFNSLALKARIQDVRAVDDSLYVIHAGGLQVFSGLKSGRLVEVGSLELPGVPRSLEVIDAGHLLVATKSGGLLALDVQNPRRPLLTKELLSAGFLQPSASPAKILVDGSRVFVSQNTRGVKVVDMSDPAQPVLMQIIQTPGVAKDLALYDDLLLVADSGEGVFIVDVKDRQRAMPVGSLPVFVGVDRIAVVEGWLISSNDPGGTLKIPLPQRLQNVNIASRGEANSYVKSAVRGRYAYAFLYNESTSARSKLMIP